VFQRWSGLLSFDVCQEPLPSLDPNPEAPPVTQLYVTRRGASAIDWAHVTIGQLTRAAAAQSRQRQPSLSLYLNGGLLASSPYQSPTTTTAG